MIIRFLIYHHFFNHFLYLKFFILTAIIFFHNLFLKGLTILFELFIILINICFIDLVFAKHFCFFYNQSLNYFQYTKI